LLVKSLEQSWQITSQEDALDYVGNKGKKNNKKPKSEPDSGTRNELESDQQSDNEFEPPSLNDARGYAKHILSAEFLPHVGVGSQYNGAKCVYLGYMVRKLLLCYVGLLPLSDRDHFANKRIHTSGMLLTSQFYKAFRQFTKKLSRLMEMDIKKNNPINVCTYLSASSIITSAMVSAVLNNKWLNSTEPQGISQQLDDFNYVAKVCFLRKFVIPMAKDGGKIEPPRHLHGSSWGLPCPYETPEGKRVGLVQNMSAGMIVTVESDYRPIIEFLSDMDVVFIESEAQTSDSDKCNATTNCERASVNCDFLKYTKIFINGNPLGYTHYPHEIVNALRTLRRTANINPEISIAYDSTDNEIRVSTDAGRAMRGLIILDEGKMKLTHEMLDDLKCGKYTTPECSAWMYLLQNGYVELMGQDEQESLCVAIYPSSLESMTPAVRIAYTHCEMSPDMIEGAGVSTSPKNNCNQAPRNIGQSSMGKQSIGVPGLNNQFHHRGKWHTLQYPQKPIVSTRIARKFGYDYEPMGQNATILIMPWYGVNQEDSLVLSQDAIDRGFMCSWAYIAYEAVIENPQIKETTKKDEKFTMKRPRFQTFEIPGKDCNDFRGNINKLSVTFDEEFGQWCYIPQGTEVEKGDILIGMTLTYADGEKHFNQSIYNKPKTNISIIYDQKYPATIHSVQKGYNGKGYRYIRLVTRQYRKPIQGDKFAARFGQKGIAGAVWPAEKMPFLKRYGYTPNILIHPIAFPSRMTIGMFIEAILGIALTSSAKKCPEYNAPLCIDRSRTFDVKQDSHKKFIVDIVGEPSIFASGENDKLTSDTNIIVKEHDSSTHYYPKNFNPHSDYEFNLCGDGTPFDNTFSIQNIINALEKMGIDAYSYEEVVNPQTGETLVWPIFSGIVYYQRLKHMVIDKVHARATGAYHALHRQPTEGRKKKGGLRVGTMEVDIIQAQGLTGMAVDRLMEQSDEYIQPICRVCGLQAISEANIDENRLVTATSGLATSGLATSGLATSGLEYMRCNKCGTSECVNVRMPFGTKLMTQEMMVLNTIPRVITLPG
jgi:DNA-directed RNA polymerase beta subunit